MLSQKNVNENINSSKFLDRLLFELSRYLSQKGNEVLSKEEQKIINEILKFAYNFSNMNDRSNEVLDNLKKLKQQRYQFHEYDFNEFIKNLDELFENTQLSRSLNFEDIKLKSNNLREFKSTNYFLVAEDPDIRPTETNPYANRYVQLKTSGIDLVADYYKTKYKTRIKTINDVSKLYDDLKLIRQSKGDIRKAFVLDSVGTGAHSTPIIYIKEKGREIILIADSAGMFSAEKAAQIEKRLKIPVFTIPDIRQTDKYSCHSDALVLSRIATAYDEKKGKYIVENLIDSIEARAQRMWKHFPAKLYSTKLPDEFNILAQLPSFLTLHSENSNKIVQRNPKNNTQKTRTEFLQFYKQRKVIRKKNTDIFNEKEVNAFLSQKGIRFADIIEIQSYINQMQWILGDAWSPTLRDQFIAQAEKIFTERVVPPLTEDEESKHSILYSYANKFLDQQIEILDQKANQVNKVMINIRDRLNNIIQSIEEKTENPLNETNTFNLIINLKQIINEVASEYLSSGQIQQDRFEQFNELKQVLIDRIEMMVQAGELDARLLHVFSPNATNDFQIIDEIKKIFSDHLSEQAKPLFVVTPQHTYSQ